MFEKFKSLLANDAIFMAILLVLVAVVSFGLGRESVRTETSIPVLLSAGSSSTQTTGVYIDAVSSTTPVILENEKAVQVVGSRSGTKYHLPTCPGTAQIKDENKIVFETIVAAKAAGYSPAANCPGLQ
jgi:spore maturation protein SpmB